VIYPSIGNFTWSKKKYTFGGQNKIGLESPKTEFGAKNQYGRLIYHRSDILYGVRKIILLRVEKVKISLKSPKREFGSWDPK
jgi:hypothetical protein